MAKIEKIEKFCMEKNVGDFLYNSYAAAILYKVEIFCRHLLWNVVAIKSKNSDFQEKIKIIIVLSSL